MTLRWCVLTGALMLAFVCATFEYKSVVQNHPGVYTRWYDGTTERVDVFYPNGNLKSTTVYGDDGKTVIILARLTDSGALVHSKVRREDGKVLEKIYSDDGKVILVQTLWVGDESYFVAKRDFFDDGTLHEETIMTKDGDAATSRRIFNHDGTLSLDVHVLPNADQESLQYHKGKLMHRGVFKANGDEVSESLADDTGKLAQRETRIALTGDTLTEIFNADGTLFYSSATTKNSGQIVSTLYEHGKMIIRQTGVKMQVSQVEEFTPGDGR
jgi:antitoxin component YwqK of YwqJK toxin-antitoxin module